MNASRQSHGALLKVGRGRAVWLVDRDAVPRVWAHFGVCTIQESHKVALLQLDRDDAVQL